MSGQPKVSVFIPLYNAEHYVAAAIESVQHQTFADWELIIIDDASQDNSYSACEKFLREDSRIRLFRNESNLGMVANWNKGIAMCHSEFFIKLDADDAWHPEMLAQSVIVLAKFPEVAMIFSRYMSIDEQGNIAPDTAIALPEFAKNKPFTCTQLVQQGSDKMLHYPILRQGLSLIRKKVFNEIGPFRLLLSPETQASSDTEFYFRVGCHFSLYCMDEVYYYYRRHDQSISNRDFVAGIQEKKMYEVKTVINDYYYEHGRITRDLWRANRRASLFLYRKFLTYQARADGKILTSLHYLLSNLITHPLRTLEFYYTRLKEHLGKK